MHDASRLANKSKLREDPVVASLAGAIARNWNVNDSSAVDEPFDVICGEFGGLDILVNCAGPRGDEVKKLTLVLHGKQAEAEGGLVPSRPVTSATTSLTDNA